MENNGHDATCECLHYHECRSCKHYYGNDTCKKCKVQTDICFYEKYEKEFTEDEKINLIHDIEEMSELQKEITKALRGKTRIISLVAEIKDVEIALKNIKKIFNIN